MVLRLSHTTSEAWLSLLETAKAERELGSPFAPPIIVVAPSSLDPETLDWLDQQTLVEQGILLVVLAPMPKALCNFRYPVLMVPSLAREEIDAMVVATVSVKCNISSEQAQLVDSIFQDTVNILASESYGWLEWYGSHHEQLAVRVHTRCLELELEADKEYLSSCNRNQQAVSRCIEVGAQLNAIRSRVLTKVTFRSQTNMNVYLPKLLSSTHARLNCNRHFRNMKGM
jgi:hypothetical protein